LLHEISMTPVLTGSEPAGAAGGWYTNVLSITNLIIADFGTFVARWIAFGLLLPYMRLLPLARPRFIVRRRLYDRPPWRFAVRRPGILDKMFTWITQHLIYVLPRFDTSCKKFQNFVKSSLGIYGVDSVTVTEVAGNILRHY
jgi:hypothetical protein